MASVAREGELTAEVTVELIKQKALSEIKSQLTELRTLSKKGFTGEFAQDQSTILGIIIFCRNIGILTSEQDRSIYQEWTGITPARVV